MTVIIWAAAILVYAVFYVLTARLFFRKVGLGSTLQEDAVTAMFAAVIWPIVLPVLVIVYGTDGAGPIAWFARLLQRGNGID
jgi:hypothetical protein